MKPRAKLTFLSPTQLFGAKAASMLARRDVLVGELRAVNAARRSFARPPVERTQGPDGNSMMLQRTSPSGFFCTRISGGKKKAVNGVAKSPRAQFLETLEKIADAKILNRRRMLAHMEARVQSDKTAAIAAECRQTFQEIFELMGETHFERQRRLERKRNTRR